MTKLQHDLVGAAVTIKATAVALFADEVNPVRQFFAEWLQTIQGVAGAIAIVVGIATLWRMFRPK